MMDTSNEENNFLSRYKYQLTLPHVANIKKSNTSKKLTKIFGKPSDAHISKKLIDKLLQYNMKYEEITKVILSHSERAFLDARLITLEEYYKKLKKTKKSEVEKFLSSLPEHELVK